MTASYSSADSWEKKPKRVFRESSCFSIGILKIEYHRDIFNMPIYNVFTVLGIQTLHISSGINPNKGLTSLFNENDCRLEGWVVVDKRRMLQSAFIFLIRVLPQLNNIRLAVTGGPLLPLKMKMDFNQIFKES